MSFFSIDLINVYLNVYDLYMFGMLKQDKSLLLQHMSYQICKITALINISKKANYMIKFVCIQYFKLLLLFNGSCQKGRELRLWCTCIYVVNTLIIWMFLGRSCHRDLTEIQVGRWHSRMCSWYLFKAKS